MTANTFREAYGVLQRHAETLRTQREPDIDNLLNIVTESVDAYKICKARIEAVELALEQALSGAGVEGVGVPEPGDGTAARPAASAMAPRAVPRPPAPQPSGAGAPDFGAADDDVPF